MGIVSVHCAALGQRVSLVTDLEDQATLVLCPQYEAAAACCRLKRQSRSQGPLASILERVPENVLLTRMVRCDFSRD